MEVFLYIPNSFVHNVCVLCILYVLYVQYVLHVLCVLCVLYVLHVLYVLLEMCLQYMHVCTSTVCTT